MVSTKALYLKSQLKRHHILIGPDVWMDVEKNPDFTEDPALYPRWKAQAASEGLRVRIGRWNVPGRPVAILVDYKSFIDRQDRILGQLWESFGVDSLSGNWDYKESALFGYAAGCAIESFYKHNLYASDKVVAQFHEWQTGAGLLYLKKHCPAIGTVFTTHATIVGRCICGNNYPLYGKFDEYNGDEMANRLGVKARHSLESKSAQNADVFTTVSEITARECARFDGRPVDIVTPNGFEDSITPSSEAEFWKKRDLARSRMIGVASAMCGAQVPDEALLVGIGGRYEFRNKGIDIFIDALSTLDKSGYDGREICAFILIPSGHNGPDRNLLRKLAGEGCADYTTQVTHALMNPEWDTITRRFAEKGLNNHPDSKVKLFFVPSYLNGSDGIFDLSYYDLLTGLDLTVFASYYEPWGYTPLESLAFGVPTLTTGIAGFGMWVRSHYKGDHPGITIVDRDDDNYLQVVSAVKDRILEMARLDKAGQESYMRNARDVAKIALWRNQIEYYKQAYALAIDKVVSRMGQYPSLKEEKLMKENEMQISAPTWRSVMVTRHLPEALSGLEKLSENLWWCWNDSAKALFKSVDPVIWHNSGHNPREVLDTVSLKRFKQLAQDPGFLGALDEVLAEFDAYMAAKSERKDPSIAYFSMEYGLDTSLKIYSGGLGILAGDYLKETSDMNVNLVAVGLLYRYGYFTQKITAYGDQVAEYDAQDFLRIPAKPVFDAEGNWLTT